MALHIDRQNKQLRPNEYETTPKRQATIYKAAENAATAKEMKDTVVGDCIKTMIAANIPFEKADIPGIFTDACEK